MSSQHPQPEPEDETLPGAICVVRDRISGESFGAHDEDAKAFPASQLHPIVSARLFTEYELVQVHRHLRRPACSRVPGLDLTTDGISELPRRGFTEIQNAFEEPTLDEIFARWPIQPFIAGVDIRHQFRRINDHVTALEQGKGKPLDDADWAQLLSTNGNHAEVKATSDALFAIDARSPEDLQQLELHLEGDDTARDDALPRCIHCSFITHGVRPTDEVLQEEREAARRA